MIILTVKRNRPDRYDRIRSVLYKRARSTSGRFSNLFWRKEDKNDDRLDGSHAPPRRVSHVCRLRTLCLFTCRFQWSDAPRTTNVRPNNRALPISAKTRVNTTIRAPRNKTVKCTTINRFVWNVSRTFSYDYYGTRRFWRP